MEFTASYFFATFKPRSYHDHTRNSSLAIRDLSWSPPGNRIACALSDKLVRVWNPEKPEIRMSTELKGHTAAVVALAWDPTHSDRLASCSPDGTVRFWDYRIKSCLAIVTTAGDNTAIAWHPDGHTVAVASKDDKLHIISATTHTLISTTTVPSSINSLIFSHIGYTLLMATSTGQVLLYDFPSLKPNYSFAAHASAALCLELDPRGAHLVVGGSDAVVGIWDTSEWICLRALQDIDAPVKSISVSFDGSYLCAGRDESGTHDIDIMHVDTGEYIHRIHTNHPVTNVKWHPSKYALAYSGDPSGMKIVTGTEIKENK